MDNAKALPKAEDLTRPFLQGIWVTLRRDYSTVVGQAVMQVPFRAVRQ